MNPVVPSPAIPTLRTPTTASISALGNPYSRIRPTPKPQATAAGVSAVAGQPRPVPANSLVNFMPGVKAAMAMPSPVPGPMSMPAAPPMPAAMPMPGAMPAMPGPAPMPGAMPPAVPPVRRPKTTQDAAKELAILQEAEAVDDRSDPYRDIVADHIASDAKTAADSSDEEDETRAGQSGSLGRGWTWRFLNKDIAENEDRWFPRLIKSDATPVVESLASPTRQAILGALAGGGLGALGGAALTSAAGSSSPSPTIALGALGALGGGIGAYAHRATENDEVINDLRFLPPGATNAERRRLQELRRKLEEERMQAEMQKPATDLSKIPLPAIEFNPPQRSERNPGGYAGPGGYMPSLRKFLNPPPPPPPPPSPQEPQEPPAKTKFQSSLEELDRRLHDATSSDAVNKQIAIGFADTASDRVKQEPSPAGEPKSLSSRLGSREVLLPLAALGGVGGLGYLVHRLRKRRLERGAEKPAAEKRAYRNALLGAAAGGFLGGGAVEDAGTFRIGSIGFNPITAGLGAVGMNKKLLANTGAGAGLAGTFKSNIGGNAAVQGLRYGVGGGIVGGALDASLGAMNYDTDGDFARYMSRAGLGVGLGRGALRGRYLNTNPTAGMRINLGGGGSRALTDIERQYVLRGQTATQSIQQAQNAARAEAVTGLGASTPPDARLARSLFRESRRAENDGAGSVYDQLRKLRGAEFRNSQGSSASGLDQVHRQGRGMFDGLFAASPVTPLVGLGNFAVTGRTGIPAMFRDAARTAGGRAGIGIGAVSTGAVGLNIANNRIDRAADQKVREFVDRNRDYLRDTADTEVDRLMDEKLMPKITDGLVGGLGSSVSAAGRGMGRAAAKAVDYLNNRAEGAVDDQTNRFVNNQLGLDRILAGLGLDPARMSPMQKLMIVGGVPAAGVGAAFGSPLLAGAGALGTALGVAPSLMGGHRDELEKQRRIQQAMQTAPPM